MDFIYTNAIKQLRKLTKRIRVVPGGTSAGKTFGILPILIDQAIKTENLTISVISESIPHLRKGALKDFLWIMKNTNRFIDDHYNKTFLSYTFASGSVIEFFSADQDGKVKGMRRDILYVNECNNISFDTYHQLAVRTDKVIWLDYNPSNQFWVHIELVNDEDAEFLTLTYKNNEALSPALIKEIEKSKYKAYINPDIPVPELFDNRNIKNFYWHNWWKVYGLGMTGSLEGVIFTNWKTIKQVPLEARLIGYAIDFGFSEDPATLIAAYAYNGKVIWDELLYMKGLKNGDLARYMKSFGILRSHFVVADSSEPKSIAEINAYGFAVRGAVKGKDSINFGIGVLQEDDFLVTERSTNFIKELRNYMWAKDKTGKSLDVPIDAFNHCFIGSTKVLTKNGLMEIKNVKEGDFVFNSGGYNKVLEKFNNGFKKTIELSIQLDTCLVSLQCTEDHKIKTSIGWVKAKNLTEKHIIYISERNTIVGQEKGCTELFGSSIMGKYLKDTTYTILTMIKKIIQSKTLNWLRQKSTGLITQKYITKTILSLLLKTWQRIKINVGHGISPMQESSNIGNKLSKLVLGILPMGIKNAKYAIKNIWQTRLFKSFAPTIVNHSLEDCQVLTMKKDYARNVRKSLNAINIREANIVKVVVQEKGIEQVFDLMIENTHEYFANGILVHNCIDPMRYLATAKLSKTKQKRSGVKRRN